MGADHSERCRDDGDVVSESDNGQHIRHGIHRHDEIGERRQDDTLGAQRRIAVDRAIIGRRRIACERYLRHHALQLGPEFRTHDVLALLPPVGFTRQKNFTDFHIIHDRRSSGHGYYMGFKLCRSIASGRSRLLHGLGQKKIALRHTLRIMGGEADLHPRIDIGPFGMMIEPFRHKCGFGHETEGFRKACKLEGTDDSRSVLA